MDIEAMEEVVREVLKDYTDILYEKIMVEINTLYSDYEVDIEYELFESFQEGYKEGYEHGEEGLDKQY